MPFILNAGQPWVGRPVRALVSGNRRPVALNDTMSLVQDSPATQIIVLGNDFDPENGTLDVVGASVDVGTVIINPNNTLSYTPPPSWVGTATIDYTIQDDVGQTSSAQVFVTVIAPTLSVDIEANNTLSVNAELGTITLTITDPATFAATYAVDTGDLASGPVNLVPPKIAGTFAAGEVLTATDGLWIYDIDAGGPGQNWQWRRNGVDISGATSAAYTVQASDITATLTAVESLTDANGARNVASAPAGNVFTPSDDPQLLGWWDASDVTTITQSGGAVSQWIDKAGGNALTQALAPQQPMTGTRSLFGMNVIDFGGGQLLDAPRTFPASGNVAFHMVLEVDSVSNLFEAVLAVEAANDFQIDANNSAQFDGRLNPTGIGAPVNLSGGPFTGPMIMSVVLDRTGAAQAEVFIADTSRGTMAYTTPIDATAALHLMTNRSKNAWIDGAVAEVIVTGDVTNREDYHGYLAPKWGLS